MNHENRFFYRYENYVPNIKVKCLDADSEMSQTDFNLVNLSFAGCCIKSTLKFSEADFVIRIGKRRIKFKGKSSWTKKISGEHHTGLQVSFSDYQSYKNWSSLLHALNAVETANTNLESLAQLSEYQLHFLPRPIITDE